jgi:hypothetical protein
MLVPSVDAGPLRPEGGAGQGPRWPRPAWLALVTVVTVIGEVILAFHDPNREMIITICEMGCPVVLILILFAAILFGSEDTKERAFRLLRWIRDKPEPPGPPESPTSGTKPEAATRYTRWRGGKRAGRRH